ncbi:hypothetical protein C8R43DRAFT_972560, partial [Mycena crocata]
MRRKLLTPRMFLSSSVLVSVGAHCKTSSDSPCSETHPNLHSTSISFTMRQPPCTSQHEIMVQFRTFASRIEQYLSHSPSLLC